ncbi:MAG: glycosyltransferase [Solirubrobacteraceae bacterium]|nr:MAG: hypothetical protein DLM63_08490 [Solirubrobacterales bacterium]
MIVHQLLSGAGPVDAVTGQALAFRRIFERWGWGGQDVAAAIDPRVDGAVRPLASLRRRPGDLQLLHYSAYAPRLRPLLDDEHRTLLLSHNITPARYLWDYEAGAAIVCALGRSQLSDFVAGAQATAGVSAYNAAELAGAGASDPGVIPPLIDRGRLGLPRAGGEPAPPVTVLCVGRLTPHKRHDAVIRAFAGYRRRHEPGARLVVVGEPLTPRYREALVGLAERLAPGAVVFESGLSEDELADRYRSAHVLLSLSEHEGFCLPIIEALHHDVPVVARAAGAVPETAGDAALLLGAQDDVAVVAETLALAVGDAALRAELGRRGAARLAQLAPERTEAALREALAGLVG